jgi:hypothetical protein
MRTRVLSAIIILLAIVVLPLTGCAKKENQAPAKGKTATPTSAKATKTPAKAPAPMNVPAAKSEAATSAVRPESKASAPTVTQAPEKPMYLGQVLVTWNTGKKGEAVNQFLQLNWQDPSVFQGIPVLAMSEQQFAALPEEQRDQISQQVQQLSQTFRDMGQAVISSTDSFIASGNAIGAKARLDAVQQFAQALAAPEHLQIIQLVGKAISQLAQEKLSGVK